MIAGLRGERATELAQTVKLREMNPPDDLDMNVTVSRYSHLQQSCKLIM